MEIDMGDHQLCLLPAHLYLVDREYFHLYEAEITAELLDAPRNPTTTTSYTAWPTIHRRKPPFKPYGTFANRLMAEFVAPSPLLSQFLNPVG
ncbi:hypothetical protein BBP40_010024 [Aspergillus hancockii]|nr:hypothetical protein BBP40_010024 [Aspergillus hancockii]